MIREKGKERISVQGLNHFGDEETRERLSVTCREISWIKTVIPWNRMPVVPRFYHNRKGLGKGTH